MTVLIVFGTRPEYLKLKPLFRSFDSHKIPYRILQVLQHTEVQVEEGCLKLDIEANELTPRLSCIGSSILTSLPSILADIDLVVVQGDTATAFYSALCAFQCKIPVAHVEAGLRTFDLDNPFPEEAYRSMISRIASIHFCPDMASIRNLRDERIKTGFHLVGNTILDQTMSYRYPIELGKSVLITIHRRENWDSIDTILQTVYDLVFESPHLTFTWVLHMNPILKEKVLSFFSEHPLPNITCIMPIQHAELIWHISSCYCVITDSGGIQEEASFLGKHCFVLRKFTERSSIPSEYITLVKEPQHLTQLFHQTKLTLLDPCHVYGDGTAADKITVVISRYLNTISASL